MLQHVREGRQGRRLFYSAEYGQTALSATWRRNDWHNNAAWDEVTLNVGGEGKDLKTQSATAETSCDVLAGLCAGDSEERQRC